MNWLAWRQFRASAYIVLGFLVVAAVACAITGPNLVHVYDTVVKPCKANNDCGPVIQSFTKKDHMLQGLSVVLFVLPALLGVFWGAPLIAREVESGTFRLAWTQSVTRRRWFLSRVLLVGVAAMVATGLLSLMVTWWSSPFDTLNNFPFGPFDHRDIVPIGYAAFAVMLGVCAGAVIRRVLPAIGATLVGFVAVRIFVTSWVRPRLASPLRLTTAFGIPGANGKGISIGGGGSPSDWDLSNSIVNAHGRVMLSNGDIGFRGLANGRTEFVGVGVCPNKFAGLNGPGPGVRQGAPSAAVQDGISKCVASFHLRDIVTYQPASRYWMFQWDELAIFLVLAVALGAFSYWWVRRRLT